MRHAIYSDKNRSSLLLVTNDLWVINGNWQIEKKNEVFYCISPHGTFAIDIYLAGYIDYNGDYNDSLARFQNGEGEHYNISIEKPIAELCKKQYYGIDCSCSKCNKRIN